VWAASCPRPERTPLDNSQSSPRQQFSFTSTTERKVLVNLERSPCDSINPVISKPKNDCVRDPVIEGGGPGRGAVVEEGERSGKVK